VVNGGIGSFLGPPLRGSIATSIETLFESHSLKAFKWRVISSVIVIGDSESTLGYFLDGL